MDKKVQLVRTAEDTPVIINPGGRQIQFTLGQVAKYFVSLVTIIGSCYYLYYETVQTKKDLQQLETDVRSIDAEVNEVKSNLNGQTEKLSVLKDLVLAGQKQ